MVSFIGGGNHRVPIEKTCRKLTNFITKCQYRVHLTLNRFELTTLVVIGTDCTCSYKSNYHMITTMTTPVFNVTSCYISYFPVNCFFFKINLVFSMTMFGI